MYDPVGSTFDGAVRVLPDGNFKLRTMTIGTCINFCVNLQHIGLQGDIKYAGVEGGNECWCGVSGAQYDQYGERDVSECFRTCAGNANQTCGGEYRIAVYDP